MKSDFHLRNTLKNIIFSIYGGFVGAVFGLYATGNHTGKQVWFLIFVYLIPVLILVYLIDLRKKK